MGGPEPAPARSERRVKLLLVLCVTLLLAGLITHGHYAGSGDAVHYMVIARSAALDFDLDLANDYGDPAGPLLGGPLPPEAHARVGRGGILRPVHDVGWPVLSAPFFGLAFRLAQRVEALPEGLRRKARLDRWIALRQLVSLAMIGLSGALALALFAFLRRLGHAPNVAALGAGALTLTAPVLNMAYVYMTEVPSALLALLLFAALTGGSAPGRVRALLLGLGTGGLLLIHARNAGLMLGLLGLGAWRLRARPLALFLTGTLAAIAVRVSVNLLFWGTLVTTPHAAVGEWAGLGSLLAESAERLAGALFDQRHGLLPLAPAYVFVAAGFVLLCRRRPSEAAGIAAVTLTYLALVVCPLTNVHGWRGGWSPPARFLVPVAPLLGACVVEVAARKKWRVFVLPVLAAQLVVAALVWNRPMLAWAEGPGFAPLLSTIAPPLASLLPRWDPPAPGAGLASIVMALAAAVPAWAAARTAKEPG